MTSDEMDQQAANEHADMVGLLQRLVRDASRRMGEKSTGQPFVHVPSALLTEAQDLLIKINPGLVPLYRAF